MSSRIIVGVVAALLVTGAAACTKSEEPKPAAPAAAPVEKPAAAPAEKPATEKPAMEKPAKPATPPAAEGGEAKPAPPKPEADTDET